MSAHLKQTICKVSQIGHELAKQPTGDDLSDLRKAKLLDKLIYQVKEMLGYAADSLEVPENTFEGLKKHVGALDEDKELNHLIEDLEEATNEPADGPSRDHVRIV